MPGPTNRADGAGVSDPAAGRRPWLSRLTLRVAASLAVLVLLPAAALGAYAYQTARDNATGQVLERAAAESQSLASRVDEYVLGQRNMARWIASATEVTGYLEGRHSAASGEELLSWIQGSTLVTPDVAAIYLLDRRGVCLVSTDPRFVGESYAMRPYFQRAMLDESYISDWSIGVTSGEPGIYLSAPVHGRARMPGTVTGVLVVKLRTEPIETAISRAAARGSLASLVNADTVVLSHWDPALQYRTLSELPPTARERIDATEQFADQPLESLGLDPLGAEVIDTAAGQTTLTRTYEADGDERVAAVTGLVSRPWAVLVEVPVDAVYGAANTVLVAAVVVAGLLLLYALITAIYLGRTVVRPLRDLVETSRRLAAGDLTARVTVRSDDEVGELAEAFNSMAGTIHDNTERLESEVTRRTAELEAANRAVTALSVTDALTGCYNRLYLDRELASAVERCRQDGHPLSVVLFDLDHFKEINDESGHAVGDDVLRAVGGYLIAQQSGDGAWSARYGGEEFVIVLPGLALAEAGARAEQVRMGIAALSASLPVPVAGSFGVAQARTAHDGADRDADSADALLRRCDRALYRAKARGRNRVVIDEREPVATGPDPTGPPDG